MKEYNLTKTIIINGEPVPLYQDWEIWKIKLACPAQDKAGLLSNAWVSMKPGMYSGDRKATVEEISHYLQSQGISETAADWAAQMAEDYYDKEDFAEFHARETEVIE